jgi:hypothetical protein
MLSSQPEPQPQTQRIREPTHLIQRNIHSAKSQTRHRRELTTHASKLQLQNKLASVAVKKEKLD